MFWASVSELPITQFQVQEIDSKRANVYIIMNHKQSQVLIHTWLNEQIPFQIIIDFSSVKWPQIHKFPNISPKLIEI